jgi:pyruvate dehydrogenase E1 component beta subunit
MPTKNYADAMLDVLGTMMEEDPNFAVMGNEVLGIGPEAPQFAPFQEKYGDRCYFPPCSEAAFAALAAGAAMCGQQIFTHLGLASFSYPAYSSIANEIAPAHLSSGGKIKVPVVLHISHGLLHGGGAQHSESPFSTYWNLPGIEIAAPSGAREVKGLLRTAFKSENPTIVITHAFLYGAEDDVPDDDYEIPFGEAAIAREGSDVTIVACSMMVAAAMQAAEQLAADGVDAEVIDLRTLVPLDMATVLASVARTSRLLIVEENPYQGGWGATVASIAADEGFTLLDAPVRRVAAACVPLPFADALEDQVIPTIDKVVTAVRQLARY